MSKFFVRICVILSMFSSNLFSFSYDCDHEYDADEKDMALSKTSFLISGYPTYAELKQKNRGMLTLCIKENKTKDFCDFLVFDHPALVFEYFSPRASEEISLCMVHFGRQGDCSGVGGRQRIIIDNRRNTLKKVYRVLKIAGDEKRYIPGGYTRYASWIIANDLLLKGLSHALDAQTKRGANYGNCVKFVAKIMQETGLQNVDFGYWFTTAENLKILVTDYIKPLPYSKTFREAK